MDDRAELHQTLLPLWQSLTTEQHQKLLDAQQALSEAGDLDTLNQRYFRHSASLLRLVGKQVVNHSAWRSDQLARLQLLGVYADLQPKLDSSQQPGLTTWLPSLFQVSDTEEKIVLLRALKLLDCSGVLVPFSLLASRTNDPQLFAALALNNEYPVAQFDDKCFQQLLLKALFMDLDITLVPNLAQRLNTQLSQLAMDLVMERVYAHRLPPPSIWMAIRAQDMSTAFRDTYLSFLAANDENQRYFSALGLITNGSEGFDARLSQLLEQRLPQENDRVVRQLIQSLHLRLLVSNQNNSVQPAA